MIKRCSSIIGFSLSCSRIKMHYWRLTGEVSGYSIGLERYRTAATPEVSYGANKRHYKGKKDVRPRTNYPC